MNKYCIVFTGLLFFIISSNILAQSAVDGIGVKKCSNVVLDLKEKPSSSVQYTSWVAGYLTAVNFQRDDTFDLTSWQSDTLLLQGLINYCDANKDKRFFNAVDQLGKALYEQRLQKTSKILKIKIGLQEFLVYQEVLNRVGNKLIQSGLLDIQVDETKVIHKYDVNMTESIKKFQANKGLKINGLPDQATLNALFNYKN